MSKLDDYRKEAKDYNYECIMYANCMREIKKRLYFIKGKLALGSNEENKIFDTEIICLQFRSIFELIYLSNLAAHYKLYTKGYEKLKKEWNIKRITEFLEKNNPDFYPTPVNAHIEQLPLNNFNIDLKIVENGFLTKDELITLYQICSNYIHPKNPFADHNDFMVWKLFEDWFSKICVLLETHVVNMFNSKRGLFVYVNLLENAKEDVYMAYLRSDKKIIH